MPWLAGERFDLALDARRGVVTSSTAGENVLTVTTHRAILINSESGKRTTGLLALSKLTGIEVIDVYRASERLPQGLLLLAVGAILGWVSWVVIGVALVSLLVGGVPVLVSIYILTGFALPDQEGAIVLHAGNYAMRLPLRTPDARRDAYLVAHRLYELASVGAVPEPSAVEAEEPEAAGAGAPEWLSAASVEESDATPVAAAGEAAREPDVPSADAPAAEDAAPSEEPTSAEPEEEQARSERGTAAPPSA